ncbi:carboxymuconolactone decarboxylase family protein [Cupriavidus alkaliphilus]|uniref:carboxymuconolactone decarboxylase family protein n=1 Tax=Cupriavidus alkaliphilus TaxID=942866 RepID=UPI001621DBDF|nr:carboxymuconolactone decarboxylase family protein [Cupriavidus alkaliphilus]MBB3013220.1 4-carboxymuconolactone decarboxylase [Cupriavidus alkaliphilus]
MERLKPLKPEELTPEQQEVHAAIASGPRGQVRGPLAMWLHRPGLANRAQALGQYCRYDSSLPPRLSELAILVMARTWMSEFEWWAHKPIALKAGVAEEVVEAIRTGQEPVSGNEDEQVIYEFLTVLHATRNVPDALYQRAMVVLGKDRVVDLVGLAGYYTLISMTINVFGVVPPDGSAPELAQA